MKNQQRAIYPIPLSQNCVYSLLLFVFLILSHCYCGKNVTGKLLTAANCSFSCADYLNKCGGPLAQSVYGIQLPLTTTTTTTATTTTTTTSTSPQPVVNNQFSSKGGSFFNKIPNSDMYFISNNIIQTTFEQNVLKCGSVCSINSSCTSFVYKTDQNCTLFLLTPNNTNLFIQSANSCIYMKIA